MVLSNETLGLFVFLLLLLLVILGVLAASAFAAAAYYRAVSRGWSPTVGRLLAAGPVTAGLAVPFAVATTTSWWDDPSPAGDMTPLLIVCACAGCGVLASVLSWRAAGALAERPRSAGLRRRRHHYGVWAKVIAALVVPVAALGWRAGGWQVAVRVFTMGFPAAAGLRLLERRYQEQAEDVDREALARQVLYLRPFGVDQRMDLYVRTGETSWGESTGWVNLESFLADEMEQRIGPLVALGSPRDVLPPGGGTRLYPADSLWQEEFQRLIIQVPAIVMVPGDTAAIDWELRTIVEERLQLRLFIITAPRRRPKGYHVLARHGLLWIRAVARLSDWHTTTWAAFAGHLAAAGLRPGGDPGPGAVLGFDDAGRQVVLGQGMHDAAGIVGLIAGRLLALESAIDGSSLSPRTNVDQ
jgi:hypothetical protein